MNLRTLISPPVFDNEVKTRSALWIYIHIMLGFVTYVGMYIGLELSDWPESKIQLGQGLIYFTTVVEIILLYILRLGKVKLVAWAQNILIFIGGSIAFLHLGGIDGPLVTFFIMMVTITAVLLSPRMTVVISALSIAIVMVSYFVGDAVFTSPYESGFRNRPENLIFSVLFLANSGFLIYLSISALLKKRLEVRTLHSALQKKNLELEREKEIVEQKVQDRTTELAAVNQQLLLQARELIEAKEKAEESDQAKSAFLASMSHEIRTPLTSIIGTADILREETQGEDRDLVDFIFDGGLRLMATLNSVLDLAQLEGRGVEMKYESLDVLAQAGEVVRFFSQRAEDKNLKLKLVKKGKGPYICNLDRAAFDRILQNLLGNALKFTHHGSVELVVNGRKNEIDIRVKDTGIGMSESYIPKLFQRFSQESTGEKRAYQGNGLGLAITKTMVDMMDGMIRAESEEGSGSTFIVTFPRLVEEVVVKPKAKSGGVANKIS